MTQIQWLPTAAGLTEAGAFLAGTGHVASNGPGAAMLFGAWLDAELSNRPPQGGKMPGDEVTRMPVLLADPSLVPGVAIPVPAPAGKAAATRPTVTSATTQPPTPQPVVDPGPFTRQGAAQILAALPEGLIARPTPMPRGFAPETNTLPEGLLAKANALPEGLIARPTPMPRGFAPETNTLPEGLLAKPSATPVSVDATPKFQPVPEVPSEAQEMPTAAQAEAWRPVSRLAFGTPASPAAPGVMEPAADALAAWTANVAPNARAQQVTSAVLVREYPEAPVLLALQQAPREAKAIQANPSVEPQREQSSPLSSLLAKTVLPGTPEVRPAIQTAEVAAALPLPNGGRRAMPVIPQGWASGQTALPAPVGRSATPLPRSGTPEMPMPPVAPRPGASPEQTVAGPTVSATAPSRVTPTVGVPPTVRVAAAPETKSGIAERPISGRTPQVPVTPKAPVVPPTASLVGRSNATLIVETPHDPQTVRVAPAGVRERSWPAPTTPIALGREVRIPTPAALGREVQVPVPMAPGPEVQVPMPSTPASTAISRVLASGARLFLPSDGPVATETAQPVPISVAATTAVATVPGIPPATVVEPIIAAVMLGDPRLRQATGDRPRAPQTILGAIRDAGAPGVVPTAHRAPVQQPAALNAESLPRMALTEAEPVSPHPELIQAPAQGMSRGGILAAPTQPDSMSPATSQPSPVPTPVRAASIPADAVRTESPPAGSPQTVAERTGERPPVQTPARAASIPADAVRTESPPAGSPQTVAGRTGERQRTSPKRIPGAGSAADSSGEAPGPRAELSRPASMAPTWSSPDAAPTSAARRAEHIVDGISRGISRGQETLDLAVDWDDIGVTRVVVRMGERRAEVEVSCVSANAASSVRALAPAIRQQLEAQGLQLGGFLARHDPSHGQGSQTGDRWADQHTVGSAPEPRPAIGPTRLHRQPRPGSDAGSWSGTLNVLA